MGEHTSKARSVPISDPMAELWGACPVSDLVTLSPDAIVAVDREGLVVLFNPEASRILGCEAEEVLGRPAEAVLPLDFHSHFQRWRQRPDDFAPSRLTSADGYTRARRKDGAEILLEVTVAPVHADDRPLLAVVMRDTTEIARARERERILAEAGEVFASSDDTQATVRGIAEVATGHLADWCLVYLVDDDEGLTRLEVVARDPADADLADELRASPVDLDHWYPAARVVESGQMLVETRPSAVSFVLPEAADTPSGVRFLGARRYVVVPLRWGGRVRGALALISTEEGRPWRTDDVEIAEELARRTALALQHAELHENAERAARARDTVLRMVVHDLGTPLASVALAVDRILRVPPDQDRRRDRRYLEGIRRSLAQIERLIRDLKDIRIAAAGELTVELEPLELGAVLSLARDQMDLTAGGVSVELEVRTPAHDVLVRGDRDRLLQLLLNLLDNAIRVSPRDEAVVVALEEDDDQVTVSVTDRGPGVPAGERPHLFDRLVHPKPPEEGRTGLGLTINRVIVEAHGGRIGVDTEEGEGSRFWFTLPRA